MKVLQINTTYLEGSTGKIVFHLMNLLRNTEQSDCHIYYGYFRKHLKDRRAKCIQSHKRYLFENFLSRILGNEGRTNYLTTKRLLLDKDFFSGDLIHLHNLHGHYINVNLLFSYIKRKNIPVVWTLHDCWAFTGHCPHFTMVDCDKWKTGCYKCPQYREYPWSLFDSSKKMYRLKKQWFTGVKDMTIVTPSQWLAGLVKQSFLKDYPVKVINNGIDLSVFKPMESDFREKHGIRKSDFVLLGVAFGWSTKKGLDVFIQLAKKLPQNYRIILVGTDDKTDKLLPKSIISIHRTQNQTELAEIYTAADIFVNPTREDNYPTVNMEAIACGTPVISFDTGGSPECIDETCGAVVPCDDVEALEKEILRACEQKIYTREDCVKKAKAFDQNEKYKEYISLYKELYDRTAKSGI